MPLYEFECCDCSNVFEELVRMGSTGEGLNCPACRSATIRKKMSTFAARSTGGKSVGGCGCGGSCGGNCGSCGGGCSCH